MFLCGLAINDGLKIFNTTGNMVNAATELVNITTATKKPTNLRTTNLEKHITKKPHPTEKAFTAIPFP